MLLIYTHKISNRLRYVTQQCIQNILKVDFELTTSVEDFIKHDGPKITYAKQPLQNEFFIESHPLLFEKGVRAVDVTAGQWNDIPYFFGVGEKSKIPFDLFAASFYLLSRYEELLFHVKNPKNEFKAELSVLHKLDALKTPLIDLWMHAFYESLRQQFDQIPERSFQLNYELSLNVVQAFKYSGRGLMRHLTESLGDIARFNLNAFKRRFSVWLGQIQDPYLIYDALIERLDNTPIKLRFFFEYSKYLFEDQNISRFRSSLNRLIKSVADYKTVALSISHLGLQDSKALERERLELTKQIHRPIWYALHSKLNLRMPHYFKRLIEAEVRDDFSMGYADKIGFRSGTSSTHFFYDLDVEMVQPLKVHPFVMTDFVFANRRAAKEAFSDLRAIVDQTQNIGGSLRFVFSNEFVAETPGATYFENLIQFLDESRD